MNKKFSRKGRGEREERGVKMAMNKGYLTMLHDSFRKSDELLEKFRMELGNGQ